MYVYYGPEYNIEKVSCNLKIFYWISFCCKLNNVLSSNHKTSMTFPPVLYSVDLALFTDSVVCKHNTYS